MEFLDGEGWPVATSKPAMSSQEAKDMVQRLVAPRRNKAEQAINPIVKLRASCVVLARKQQKHNNKHTS